MSERSIASFDGTSLYVVEDGVPDGPAVVLSHALGGTLRHWDLLVEALAPRFRVIRYDSRGHGRSDVPTGDYSNEMMGRDALAVLDALRVTRTHFVGLSQGGMSGMWLAANAPERVDKLVLANTTAFIPAKDPWDALIRKALQQGLADIASTTIASWVGETYKRESPDGVADLVRTMEGMLSRGYAGAAAALRDVDLRPALPKINAKTLVIAGIEDGPRGAGAAAALVTAIPDARRVDLPAAGHLSAVENPPAFNAAVLEFLV